MVGKSLYKRHNSIDMDQKIDRSYAVGSMVYMFVICFTKSMVDIQEKRLN